MSQVNGYTLIGAVAVAGAAYYIYSVSKQNKKQTRLNPKRREPIPKHRAGHNLAIEGRNARRNHFGKLRQLSHNTKWVKKNWF